MTDQPTISQPELDKSKLYPQTDVYQFGEFAYAVIEIGGYGDATLIDPYTGRRLWVPNAFLEATEQFNPSDILRKLADAVDETKFWTTP